MALLNKRIILTSFEAFIRVDHLFHSLKHYLKRLNAKALLANSITEKRHCLGIKFLYLNIFLPHYFPQQD